MRPPNRLALLALALPLSACQVGGTSTATTPPAAANAVGAGPVPSPPPPLVNELKGAAAVAQVGRVATPLQAGSESTVDPKATFRVELPFALVDARLSLIDAGDALVPSAGTREVGQATVLTLSPAAAPAAGARLRLRVDGAATRELHAVDGRRFAPVEWPLVVAGEPEARKSEGRKVRRR